MEQQNRRFVGLDFGVRTYEMCMYDENGKIIRSNGLTTPEGRQKLFSKLKPTDRVGIEMCSLTMKVAREMKSAVGCDVLLLHAGKLAVIYKSLKKTDKEDALKLARLVKTHDDEELPVVPLPSETDLKRRRMIREAKQLRSDRTKEVNRLHALFVECGVTDIKKKNLKDKLFYSFYLWMNTIPATKQYENINTNNSDRFYYKSAKRHKTIIYTILL